MNAAAEATHFDPLGALGLEASDLDTPEQGVWVEAQGPTGDVTATLKLHHLPTVLAAPVDRLGNADPDSVAAGVLLLRMARGTLRAQPLGETRACFNSGPPTRLAHEFETWAFVEVAGQRFRVNNADSAANTGRNIGRPARSNWVGVQQSICSWSARLAAPILTTAAGLGGLTLSAWLSDTGQADFVQLLIKQKQTLLYGLVWWAMWCAGTRWLADGFRWRAHARVASLAMLAFGSLALVGPVFVAALNPFIPGAYRLSGLAAELGWVPVAFCAALAHVAAIPAERVVRARLRAAVCAVSLALVVGPAWEWVSAGREGVTVAPTLPAALSLERVLEPREIEAQLQVLRAAADASRQGRP